MKTMESLKSSFNARLEQLEQLSGKLQLDATKAILFHNNQPCENMIAKMRSNANLIVQCVHEISAYHNAMHTD